MTEAGRNPLADSRTTAWEWLQLSLLVANLAWTTLCLGGFRAETMVVTSTLTGVLLGVHLLERAFGPTVAGHPAGWCMLPFLAYAAANAWWISPVPWLAGRDWLGWAQMIVVFWVVLNGVRSSRGRAGLFGALVGLALLAVVLAAYQRFVEPRWLMLGRTQSDQFIGRASGPFGIPNSLAGFLILLLPPVAALAIRRSASPVQIVLCTYGVLVLLFGLVLTISRGGWLSLGAVLLVWPFFAIRRSLVRRVAVAAAVLAVLLALASALSSLVPRIHERFVALRLDRGEISRPILWHGAWQIFRDQPVWGGGAGSFNVRFERFRPASFQDEPLWPHNEYLNVLCDYGAVGLVLLVGGGVMIIVLGHRARYVARTAGAGEVPAARPGRRRHPSWWPVPRHAFAAGLAAFALQAALDFHLKIPALSLSFAVVAALWVQASWPTTAQLVLPSRRRSQTAVTAAVAVTAVTLLLVRPIYRAEALRADARQLIDRIALHRLPRAEWPPLLNKARVQLQQAVDTDPANAAAWADLSYVIALSAPSSSSADRRQSHEARRAADRALEESVLVPEFWIRRGMAFDLEQRWIEAGGAFVRAIELAPARADVWYQQARHLALVRTEAGRALAAAEFCLRLDPANREAQALRQRLADRNRAP